MTNFVKTPSHRLSRVSAAAYVGINSANFEVKRQFWVSGRNAAHKNDMEQPTLTAIPAAAEDAAHKISMSNTTITLAPLDLTGRRAEELPDLLSITEVSTYLRVPVNTLYFWSANGNGPIAVKLGKHLRYHRDDVVSFLRTKRAA